ncbi:hypothetical protein [Halobacillus salinus]|uniref:hypothetical protein n=1 Tax=Halobacillus salinus TaxID=192814 RepID=UPI0009A724CF|nr:hypothetical protein [Halobacillus salinus]
MESLQNSVYWDFLLLLLGAVLGWLVPVAIKTGYVYRLNQRTRKRVKDLGTNRDLNIITLSSAVPSYKKDHLSLRKKDGLKFLLAFPDDLFEAQTDRELTVHKGEDLIFNQQHTLDELGQSIGIPDLEELMAKHKRIIAEKFVRGEDGCLFNGTKFGVHSMKTDLKVTRNEDPKAVITLYETDYFTHRVMRSVYKELIDRGHPMTSLDSVHDLTKGKYRLFTTSIGLNIMLVMDSKEGESVILSQRSSRSAYEENHYRYNSTVMEGISLVDYDEFKGGVDLYDAVKRGLFEEIGLSRVSDDSIFLHDLFMEMNYFEIGITASVQLDGAYEEDVEGLPANDGELEIIQKVPVPMRASALKDFVEKKRFYSQGLYTLKMVASRHNIKVSHKKST